MLLRNWGGHHCLMKEGNVVELRDLRRLRIVMVATTQPDMELCKGCAMAPSEFHRDSHRYHCIAKTTKVVLPECSHRNCRHPSRQKLCAHPAQTLRLPRRPLAGVQSQPLASSPIWSSHTYQVLDPGWDLTPTPPTPACFDEVITCHGKGATCSDQVHLHKISLPCWLPATRPHTHSLAIWGQQLNARLELFCTNSSCWSAESCCQWEAVGCNKAPRCCLGCEAR